MIFNEIGFFSEAMMTVSNVLILVFHRELQRRVRNYKRLVMS